MHQVCDISIVCAFNPFDKEVFFIHTNIKTLHCTVLYVFRYFIVWQFVPWIY